VYSLPQTCNKFGKYGIDWSPKLLSAVLVVRSHLLWITSPPACSLLRRVAAFIVYVIQYVENEKNMFFDLLEEAPVLPCLVA
jgi:hypothetical protein